MSDQVEILSVIHTRLRLVGKGTEADPMRLIDQFWTMEGELLAVVDPVVGIWPNPARAATSEEGADK